MLLSAKQVAGALASYANRFVSSVDTDSTLNDLYSSSGSLSILPAYPSIFHGRDTELREVVNSLTNDSESSRIAILGAGGMGKTSLSIAALHDSEVAKKFTN